MDIGAQLARLEARLTKVERSSRLSSASLDGTALVARDDAGNLRAIVGQQADGTTAVNVVNGGPPPAPGTPTAGPALGGISAGWDGSFAGGVIMPLDWARVEIHASPDAGFTATANTLKATIETAQGGIVYIPATAPQYVRLMARNTSGAASTPTAAVGPYAPKPISAEIGPGGITTTLIADDAITTPKLFANAVTTPKLSAGSVDATALKADAITGKVITGGTITGTDIIGGTVTGGVLQTGSTGARTVITPTPPAGLVQRPSVLMYSGVTGENWPAIFNSGESSFTTGQATTVLTAPMTGVDATGASQTSQLTLNSAKPGTFGASCVLSTSNHATTSDTGYARLTASAAATTSEASFASLGAQDGSDTGKLGSVYVTGAYVTVTTDNVTSTFNASGLTIPGTISARNTPTIVTKSAATDRVSTTSRTADPDLTLSLAASATYIVEFHLYTGGSSFALTVTEWLVPSGATGLKGAMGPSSSATEGTAGNNNADGVAMRSGAHGFGTTVTYGRRNVNTNLCYAIETGTVTTTSAGTLALGWAQSTSSTTFNRMGQGSWMRVTRIA